MRLIKVILAVLIAASVAPATPAAAADITFAVNGNGTGELGSVLNRLALVRSR